MMHRDPTFDIEQMQSAMPHLYLDNLSRVDGTKGGIAGRGVTMATETSTSYKCGKKGHYPRNCTDKNDGTVTWGRPQVEEQGFVQVHGKTRGRR